MVTTKSGSAPSGDRRVRRTRSALQRALIDLVDERDLSQISVADVVEAAEVNRSTFYDHYRDVHELAEAACTSMIDDLIGVVLALDPAHANTSESSAGPDPALTAFFAHFADHVGLYRSLLGPTGSARVIEHVRLRITAAAYPSGNHGSAEDIPHDVPAAFIAGALLGVATDWLRRGCPLTPTEMTVLTKPLLRALAAGVEAGRTCPE
ncbi:AcrR family transcriptional regulator [Kibdelosporangium banguiense]|uniref:AcrR family transcriptional regulator n=1 Tax=Kibdelosporangium banguiense TaxID=1365924 RepID=A0ABS4TSZ2_9PSEU|nr:TetR/AcrR family transcriptional regulator [Kibdelosporangium banguiense]MBP2327099.1 AcrR family transcriptional regulator [Kibdelosporangium banguiense]